MTKKCKFSMMTITRPLTYLTGVHPRELVFSKKAYYGLHVKGCGGTGEIDIDPSLAEALHGPCSHAADNNGINPGIVQDFHRNHTAACLMSVVDNGFNTNDILLRTEADNGKDIAMAEMLGPGCLKPPGIIRGNSYSHFFLRKFDVTYWHRSTR
jgi:hypothetical protein